MRLRFSILICTFNRARSLATTLARVASLAGIEHSEILVIDNGSADDTMSVVRAAAKDAACAVRYLRDERRGKSVALNTGIAAADGEIVAFTDDDALPAADWLETLDRAFASWRCDWAFGRVVPRWSGTAPVWFCPEMFPLFALVDLGEQALVITREVNGFFGVNCAATRTALAAAGPYREDLGPTNALGGGGEDIEMFQRVLALGQRIVYEPAALVEHVIPASRMSRGFHRRKVFALRRQVYRAYQLDRAKMTAPHLLGLPRFLYTRAAREVVAWAAAVVRRDAGKAFHLELRLIQFGGLVEQGLRRAIDRAPNRPGQGPAVKSRESN